MLVVLVTFTSCSNYTERDALTMASTYVPGFDFQEGHNIITEPIETDNQGRVLFLIKNTVDKLMAIAIIQKSDTKYVYFYEDINYFYTDTYSPSTSELVLSQIDELKINNDWGKPLAEEKMSRRKICIYITNVIDKKIPGYENFALDNIKTTMQNKFGYSNDASVEILLQDFDNDSTMFFALRVNTNIKEYDSYYAIVSRYRDPVFLPVDDLYADIDKIHEFKLSHHWNFGIK